MSRLKKIVAVLIVALFVVPQVALAAFNIGINNNGVGGSGFNFGFNSGGGAWNTGNLSMFGLPQGSIFGIIQNLLSWLLAIFGFLGIIGFVIAGIMYVLSAGNDSMIDKAKSAMKWSIIGIVVGLMGLVVIQAVGIALQGNGTF